MDRTRDDADLGPPGARCSRAVGSDEACTGLAHDRDNRNHVECRYPLGDAEDRRDARPGRLEDGVGRTGRRHENARGVGALFADGLLDGVEHGDPIVERLLAAFPGCHAGHERSAVVEHRARVEVALPAGDSLDDESRVAANQDAHRRALTRRRAGCARPRRPPRLPRRALRPCGTVPRGGGPRLHRRWCRRSGRPSGPPATAARGPR